MTGKRTPEKIKKTIQLTHEEWDQVVLIGKEKDWTPTKVIKNIVIGKIPALIPYLKGNKNGK